MKEDYLCQTLKICQVLCAQVVLITSITKDRVHRITVRTRVVLQIKEKTRVKTKKENATPQPQEEKSETKIKQPEKNVKKPKNTSIIQQLVKHQIQSGSLPLKILSFSSGLS